MNQHWSQNAIFYHIYPLGFCGAPERNDFRSPAVTRLDKVHEWIGHLRDLGVNALYLGPIFESTAHGYDTADYFWVDRRLGTNETLRWLVRELHSNGIRVVLDGVFNHVGRDFWAFRDVLQNRENSPYCNWFKGISFGGRSPYGDPFSYEGWAGNYDLVKLNLDEPAVKEHLLLAVKQWIVDYEIDGFRLDVADTLDLQFQRELGAFCRGLRPDFWLMGEVIHGDYRRWANPETLNSVTNYEAYKGLYSSLEDKNYFEIAYALNRQFGAGGIYRDLPLYNFVDNHDVNRVASNLSSLAHLYPLYCLLFTMPGVPSIYYGSEWGLTGKRTKTDDRPLRPCPELDQIRQKAPQPDLAKTIRQLAQIRQGSAALKAGDYTQLFVSGEQLAFSRKTENEQALVLLNAAQKPSAFELPVALNDGTRLVDLLNPAQFAGQASGESFRVTGNRLRVESVPSCWARILQVQ
jgi:cyclomaltodextrinase / maltogenic alpha-amylase / neopullulanase